MTFVGLVKSTITYNDPDFHARKKTVQGSRNATREDFEREIAAITVGCVDIDDYITHRSSLEDMIDRFDSWLLPESKVIKALVELN